MTEIKPINYLEESLEDILKKIRECEANGHPFEHIIISPYNGKARIPVKCTGCGIFCMRFPTNEEYNQYQTALKLKVNT